MLRREKKSWSRSVDLDDDSLGEYFTYRPLSNLPTPPPSRRNCLINSPNPLEEGEFLKPKFLGPAIHLVNLIPAAASLATPSVPLVQAILTRAKLPVETIALAVCVLDALDSKFALGWRLSCPLAGGPASQRNVRQTAAQAESRTSKRHTLPAAFNLHETRLRAEDDRNDVIDFEPLPLHIDSVSPELIILAALVIAIKFVDDPHSSSQYFCSRWGRDIWSCEQLNITERCIMDNLGWRIMPLYDEDLLADAMVDMQLAVRHRPDHWYPEEAGNQMTPGGSDDGGDDDVSSRRASESNAVGGLGLGMQLTPPNEEILEDHFRDLDRATAAAEGR